MVFYKKDKKYGHLDGLRKDMGSDHDELAERAYMKRQMEARRKIERLRDIAEADEWS